MAVSSPGLPVSSDRRAGTCRRQWISVTCSSCASHARDGTCVHCSRRAGCGVGAFARDVDFHPRRSHCRRRARCCHRLGRARGVVTLLGGRDGRPRGPASVAPTSGSCSPDRCRTSTPPSTSARPQPAPGSSTPCRGRDRPTTRCALPAPRPVRNRLTASTRVRRSSARAVAVQRDIGGASTQPETGPGSMASGVRRCAGLTVMVGPAVWCRWSWSEAMWGMHPKRW
jgi:hypothetical protein